jgi:hypothetical protein
LSIIWGCGNELPASKENPPGSGGILWRLSAPAPQANNHHSHAKNRLAWLAVVDRLWGDGTLCDESGGAKMSEILRGVLNMPPELWSDQPIEVAQRHSIYKSAWREIDRLTRERDALANERFICDQLCEQLEKERDEARAVIENHIRSCQCDGDGKINPADYVALLAGIEASIDDYRNYAAETACHA